MTDYPKLEKKSLQGDNNAPNISNSSGDIHVENNNT
jgi:hypothetical protein